MATNHNKLEQDMLKHVEACYQYISACIEQGCTDFTHRESVVQAALQRNEPSRLFREAVLAFTSDATPHVPKIIIHCVRHAQGPHNLPISNEELRELKDPGVTDFGVLQCAMLCKTFPCMDKITHIVSSPSRQTILTTRLTFRPLLNRGIPIVLLGFLKERGKCRANSGSPIEDLQREFSDMKINYDHLEEGWETNFMDYETHGWKPMAIEMRRKLFKFGEEALRKGEANGDGNIEMVVTSHANTLRVLDGTVDEPTRYHWSNTEYRAYEFFSEERAKKRDVLRWQGLRQCLSKEFTTSAIKDELLISDLEAWGWKESEIEKINVYRDQGLLGFQKMRADRRRLIK